MYETINSPINYGGLPLKNRIIFAPTSLGLPQTEQLELLKKIACGGCAMIIIGDVPVLPSRFGPSLYTKKGFDYYRTLTDMLHAQGYKICAQLHQSDSNLKGMIRYIPGVLTKRISMEELRPLLNQQVGPYITNLPIKKVQSITSAFGTAAKLAVQAGFDMIPGSWGPDVRKFCFLPVQSTHRLLWRKSRKSCAVCCGSCHCHPPRSARSAH